MTATVRAVAARDRVVTPRAPWVVALGLASLLAIGLGWTVAVALGVAALTTIATLPRAPSGATALGWMPVGALVALFPVVLASGVASAVGVPLWGSLIEARVALALITGGIAVVGLLRGGEIRLASLPSAGAWALALPLAALAWLRLTWPFAEWSGPVWAGTDWTSHAEKTVYLRDAGVLDYLRPAADAGGAADIYPRGMHAALAWLLQAGETAQGREHDWEQVVTSLAGWSVAMLALVLAAGGLTAFAAARALSDRRWVAVVAVVGTVVALVYPAWFAVLQWSGFLTTATAAVLMFAVVIVVLTPAGMTERLVILLALLAVAAHIWQLIAAPVVLVVALVGWAWWRRGRSGLVWVVVTVVGAAVSVVTITRVTLTSEGVDQVQVGGLFPAPSWPLVVVTCVAALFGAGSIVRRGQRLAGWSWAALICSTLVVAGAAGWAAGGFGHETPYYAGKLLWHAVTVALPLAGAALLVAADRLWVAPARRVGQPLVRIVLLAVPAVLLVALLGGTASVEVTNAATGLLARPAVPPVDPLVALRARGVGESAGRAAVAWSIAPGGFSRLAPMLDWHAARALRSAGHLIPAYDALVVHRPGDICAWLVRYPDALRITGSVQGPNELLEAGCPASVVRPDVWQVVGQGPDR